MITREVVDRHREALLDFGLHVASFRATVGTPPGRAMLERAILELLWLMEYAERTEDGRVVGSSPMEQLLASTPPLVLARAAEYVALGQRQN